MIRSLVYLVIILIGLSLSPYILGNTGYVYVAFGDWQLETSLIFAIAAIVVFVAALQLLEWFVIGILSMIFRSRYLPNRWRQQAAKKHTHIAALALAEEDWAKAEKLMVKGAMAGEWPAVNYFAAARAAQKQAHYQARDNYLLKASEFSEAKLGASISQIRYWLQQGKIAQAKQQLDSLSPDSKSSLAVLKIALEVLTEHQAWDELKLLLPALKKRKVLDNQQHELLETRIHAHLLKAAQSDLNKLEACWHWLSRQQRQQPELISHYAQGLSACGKHAEAIKLLLKSIDNQASPRLFEQLMTSYQIDDTKVVPHLLKLATSYTNNVAFQRCLTQIHLKNRDIKAAVETLNKLCQLEPDNLTNWLDLAKVYEQQGHNQQALQCFHKAMGAHVNS
ncbi:heme biosynthesis HemY N-terminal domain-containing protein [Shewanella sp. NIFS-20-20]|uniref:heme biosynthesis HemY N-terminal domain-containing protein n=1 Tax=Shewanella sp. NIFS-20-20 TaxID=2853806 RepID=UPI001C4401DD|nr:heme biosynthesis HemY N-terminal domain-containing protein [Shewanella sp. NIFS-20-20]MBV7317272.1 tetratricopeptide repeat protein [Shewanella sp. NIFS-20-20]